MTRISRLLRRVVLGERGPQALQEFRRHPVLLKQRQMILRLRGHVARQIEKRLAADPGAGQP
jgi:hypothetical protein